MPHHSYAKIVGTVTHVFAHRFVMKTGDGHLLADLTRHGHDRVALRVGDNVEIEGEKKPSEIKVSKITHGEKTITIDHSDKRHGPRRHEEVDPKIALRAARDVGFEPIGEPHRKPKHFEVLGRRGEKLTELHIELDGHIRKQKPIASDDPKWAARA